MWYNHRSEYLLNECYKNDDGFTYDFVKKQILNFQLWYLMWII